MPSTTDKQAHFMAAACNNKDFADKVGMDQKVACEFFKADQNLKECNLTFLEYHYQRLATQGTTISL